MIFLQAQVHCLLLQSMQQIKSCAANPMKIPSRRCKFPFLTCCYHMFERQNRGVQSTDLDQRSKVVKPNYFDSVLFKFTFIFQAKPFWQCGVNKRYCSWYLCVLKINIPSLCMETSSRSIYIFGNKSLRKSIQKKPGKILSQFAKLQ